MQRFRSRHPAGGVFARPSTLQGPQSFVHSIIPVEASRRGRLCTAVDPTRSATDYPHNNPGRGGPSTLQGSQSFAHSTIPVEASRRWRLCTAIDPTRSSILCPLNDSGRGIQQGEALHGHRPYKVLNRMPTERFRSRHPAGGGFARPSTLQGSPPITTPRMEKACLFLPFPHPIS